MGERWGADEARSRIAVPGPADDKYSRGVLGVVTGSATYPGAAVLGVEAALRTGVGMLRYLGPGRPTRLVLQRRPEAVTVAGRAQAWLIGSGQDARERDGATRARLQVALDARTPLVIDSGALDLAAEAARDRPVVVTPHAGELAGLLGIDRAAVSADPAAAARTAAARLGAVVLAKGHMTHAATPAGRVLTVDAPTTWLATAGTGDALAGILGALVATHAEAASDPDALAGLAATAAVLHGLAAAEASAGGPITVLDLCARIPAVIGRLLAS